MTETNIDFLTNGRFIKTNNLSLGPWLSRLCLAPEGRDQKVVVHIQLQPIYFGEPAILKFFGISALEIDNGV